MERKSHYKSTQETSLEWTKEHDIYLQSLVEMYGDGDWAIISECMNNKFKGISLSTKDCRTRWKTTLDTSGGKQSWSDRERYLLMVAHRKYKNKWSDVARMLHKQSSNLIKNRFYTLFRKIKNRIKNNDLAISSPLDLLEIYFVIELIEEYHQLLPDKQAHGIEYSEKNYAYKLVQQIEKTKVAEFKAKIIESHSKEGNITELFNKYEKIYIPQPNLPNPGINIIIEPAHNEEAMDCEEIQFAKEIEEEPKIKITLPRPNSFHNSEAMTDEEKVGFWKNAFAIKESLSAKAQINEVHSAFSASSAMHDNVYSAGAISSRQDEHFDFSQFATPFEAEDKKMCAFAAPSSNNFSQYGSQLEIPPIIHPLTSGLSPKVNTVYPYGIPHGTHSAFQPIHTVNSELSFQNMLGGMEVQQTGLRRASEQYK